eukprot:1622671-Pleurochrysis_carterae.AAC.1
MHAKRALSECEKCACPMEGSTRGGEVCRLRRAARTGSKRGGGVENARGGGAAGAYVDRCEL